jgi:hypothetical protein
MIVARKPNSEILAERSRNMWSLIRIFLVGPLLVVLCPAQGPQPSAKEPTHTKGRILCFGTVAPKTKISVAFFDSIGLQSQASPTTDSAGKFDVLLTCPGSNNVSEHFVIRRYVVLQGPGPGHHEVLLGPGATIPSTCCCGQLGDVEVCEGAAAPQPASLPVPVKKEAKKAK